VSANTRIGDWLDSVIYQHGRPVVRWYLCGHERSSEASEIERQDGVVGQACPRLVDGVVGQACPRLVVVQVWRIFM
jgi:hypothetical protein